MIAVERCYRSGVTRDLARRDYQPSLWFSNTRQLKMTISKAVIRMVAV